MNKDSARRPRVRGQFTSYRNYRIDKINEELERNRSKNPKQELKTYNPCNIGHNFQFDDNDYR